MTVSIAYLTSFGAQTLHNGTTHHAGTVITQSAKALTNLITLPNGAIYDPNGSAAADIAPRPFTCEITLKYSTAALAIAEYETICALVGTRATVTATKHSTGSITCTARLSEVTYKNGRVVDAMNTITAALTFEPVTNWS